MDNPTLSKRIKDAGKVAQILQNEKNIAGFTPRVEGSGLVSTGDKSLGAYVIGIDPAREKNVTTLYKSVTVGRYLNENDSKKVLIGYKAAKKLGVGVNDILVILTQAADGSLGAEKYEIAGIFDTGMEEMDDYTIIAMIRDSQQLFVTGDEVTGFALKLKDRSRISQTMQNLRILEDMGLENHPWQKLLPAVTSAVSMHALFINFINVTVFLIIGIGIMNTISMSTLERNREFGIMLALGTTEAQMMRIVIYESFMLGILGILSGFALGGAITGYFAATGINLAAYNEALSTMPGLSPITYPRMEIEHFVFTGSWILAITILVSFYPAWRVGKLEPVNAIRGIRAALSTHAGINAFWNKISFYIFPSRFIFIHLAWRNITRNMVRSGISVLAVAVGLGSMIFFYSMVDGFLNQMINNTTRYIVGDMQLSTKGFHDNISSDETVSGLDNVNKILAENKNIASFAPRIMSEALLNTTEKSLNILLIGIDPDKEKDISGFDKVVQQGVYISSKDKNGIMLGSQIAEKLKVSVGDKVVVMVQDSVGSLSSEAFRVQGIVKTGVDSIDKVLVIINIQTAQSLLSVDGASIVFIKLKDKNNVDNTASALNSRLEGSPEQVYTWKEILPIIIQLLDFIKVSLNIFLFVLFGIIILGMMNTILMGVLERVKEFGMMMALGTRRSQVIRLVIYELMFLGILGLIVGNFLAIMIVGISHYAGFDLAFFSPGEIITLEKMPGIETVIYPRISFQSLIFPSATIFILSLLAGLYPAWKAASFEPVQAMRQI